MSSEPTRLTAEQRFRQAFERLKANNPTVLKAGTPVSQNNVAKEAGCDPSALRKGRFPSLIREIQAYVEINEQERPSKRKEQLKQRKIRSGLKDRLAEVAAQRDIAQSQLASAQRRIIELASQLKGMSEQLDSIRSPPAALRR
ncbi:MAG: hypothetical protein AB7S55_05375 [Thiomonas sp.]|jgi:hypothetical protein